VLLPASPIDRAIVRRWFGWSRTAYFYQIDPLYLNVVAPRLLLLSRDNASNSSNSSEGSSRLAKAIIESTEHLLKVKGVAIEDTVPLLQAMNKAASTTAEVEASRQGKEKETPKADDEDADLRGHYLELQARIDHVESELRASGGGGALPPPVPPSAASFPPSYITQITLLGIGKHTHTHMPYTYTIHLCSYI